jgi:hypothetical protein
MLCAGKRWDRRDGLAEYRTIWHICRHVGRQPERASPPLPHLHAPLGSKHSPLRFCASHPLEPAFSPCILLQRASMQHNLAAALGPRRYGVPASASALFEDAFRAALPAAFKAQPDLLFQLVTMLSPRILRQHGVPVCSATQASTLG